MVGVRKTKIIASIGPASWSEDIIARLLHEGVDAFRINLAHGNREVWDRILNIVRNICKEHEYLVPVIADLQGPTLRLGDVEEYSVKKGDVVRVVEASKGTKGELPIPSRKFFEALEEGDIILIEGGRLKFRVEAVKACEAKAEALNDGDVKSRKTVMLQGKELDFPPLTDKDLKDVEYCVERKLDYISLSFVRRASDISTLRNLLEELGAPEIKIIAKIETRSAVENLSDIVAQADAVLVARGDLGLYFSLERIPALQEMIVKECLRQGKPCIIATQLLESMVSNPLPSRAEVVDVMNAVRQGVDALLLAGETAIGAYPVEAVRWLKRIILEAEKDLKIDVESGEETLYDKFARGVKLLADSIGAKIVAYTKTGKTANRISRYRPSSPIYAFTPDLTVARQLNLMWGIKPFYVTGAKDKDEAYRICIETLRKHGEISYGDIIVFITGLKPKTTDLMRIEIIK